MIKMKLDVLIEILTTLHVVSSVVVSETRRQQGEEDDDINITKLQVPLYVLEGDDVQMRCSYESNLEIYSIKWYRNDKEFFHFIPSQTPSKRTQPMPGVIVDTLNSTGKMVILKDIDLNSDGRYKCEVTAVGWPHYYTSDRSAPMTVVVLPMDKPSIVGATRSYRVGDIVNATCISAPSKPKAKLTWIINDSEVSPSLVKEPPAVSLGKGIEQSLSTLSFRAKRDHFVNGKLKLRCSARIPWHNHEKHERAISLHGSGIGLPVVKFEEKEAISGGNGCVTGTPLNVVALHGVAMVMRRLMANIT